MITYSNEDIKIRLDLNKCTYILGDNFDKKEYIISDIKNCFNGKSNSNTITEDGVSINKKDYILIDCSQLSFFGDEVDFTKKTYSRKLIEMLLESIMDSYGDSSEVEEKISSLFCKPFNNSELASDISRVSPSIQMIVEPKTIVKKLLIDYLLDYSFKNIDANPLSKFEEIMIVLTVLEHFSKSISGKKIVWILGDILNELDIDNKIVVQNKLSDIAQKHKLSIVCSTKCIVDLYSEYNKCNFLSIITDIIIDLYKDGHFLDDIETCYPDKSNSYEEDLLKYMGVY